MGEVVESRGPRVEYVGVKVKRLGILLSGRGSNFEAIAKNIERGRLSAQIAVVISNRPEARGLEIARERGLQAVCCLPKACARDEYDQRCGRTSEPRRGTGLPGWIHATAEPLVLPRISAARVEHSSFAVARVSRPGCPDGRRWSMGPRSPAARFISWTKRLDAGPDHFAGCRAGAGRRYS